VARFEVISAVFPRILAVWDVMQCRQVKKNRYSWKAQPKTKHHILEGLNTQLYSLCTFRYYWATKNLKKAVTDND
jgi:hypothetical protein